MLFPVLVENLKTQPSAAETKNVFIPSFLFAIFVLQNACAEYHSYP